MTSRIAHVAKGVGYRVGNSYRGTRRVRAARRGARRAGLEIEAWTI